MITVGSYAKKHRGENGNFGRGISLKSSGAMKLDPRYPVYPKKGVQVRGRYVPGILDECHKVRRW